MDHHTLAAVSITGTFLDVVGSLYLAYDLLGGQGGPLRVLTHAVTTYSLVFGIGFFGVMAGIATGITLSIELNRAARGLDHYSLPWEGVFATIRGLAFGAGLYRAVGFGFAVSFAALIIVGQILAYSRGMRPALDYVASRRPRMSSRQFWGTVIRTAGYIASALTERGPHHSPFLRSNRRKQATRLNAGAVVRDCPSKSGQFVSLHHAAFSSRNRWKSVAKGLAPSWRIMNAT